MTRAVLAMPYDMLSFQPAAYIGDDRRWKEDFTDVGIDRVWEKIEEGAGQKLPWQGTQFGDPRCNRYTAGLSADGTFTVLVDPDNPADLAARDTLLSHHGGMILGDHSTLIRAADPGGSGAADGAQGRRSSCSLSGLAEQVSRREVIRCSQLHGRRRGGTGLGVDAAGEDQ